MIVIHDKEIVAQLAYEDTEEWTAAVGTKVEIDGIEFSFVIAGSIFKGYVLVSELSSGASMLKYQVSPDEFLDSDTRGKAHELYRKVAEVVQKRIEYNGLENVHAAIKKAKLKTEKALGKMPEIVECDFFEEAHK